MNTKKPAKYVHPANPVKAQADADRARSHAYGTHTQGTPRERSRADNKRAEIKRQLDTRTYA